MKKIIFISIILVLESTVLSFLLNTIFTNNILSRVVYGVDYSTYLEQSSFLEILVGSPTQWIFDLSRGIITILCIVVMFFTIKKLKRKYIVTKEELKKIMIIFSIITLYEVILYAIMFHSIPPFNFFIQPIVFIFTAFICIYKFMYIKNEK